MTLTLQFPTDEIKNYRIFLHGANLGQLPLKLSTLFKKNKIHYFTLANGRTLVQDDDNHF
jgi:hypothetical protein